jgi:hypothetical protein
MRIDLRGANRQSGEECGRGREERSAIEHVSADSGVA